MGAAGRGGYRRVRSGARASVAGLATGGALMLSGAVFLIPFLVSDRAGQNDVFMGNLFLGPPFWLAGSTLLIASLAGLGLRAWMTVGLAVANLLLVSLAALVLSRGGLGGISGVAAVVVADVGALLVASALVAGTRGWWATWGRGMVLAAACAGIVTLAYVLLGGRYYAFGETSSSLPPYLEMPVVAIALGMGALAGALGWVWGGEAGRSPRPQNWGGVG